MLFFMNSRVTTKRVSNVMYYNNKISNYCKHYGDDTTGSNAQHESDNEVIFIQMNKIPEDIDTIAVVLNAYTGEKLSEVPSLKARVYSGEPGNIDEVLGTFDMSEHKLSTTSVVVGFLKKCGGEWSFSADGREVRAHHVSNLKNAFDTDPELLQQTSVETKQISEPDTDNKLMSFIKRVFS